MIVDKYKSEAFKEYNGTLKYIYDCYQTFRY